MKFRAVRAAAIVSALFISAAPAFAQSNRADSYVFLEAVRKDDGNTVTKMVNESGSRAVELRDKDTGETAIHITARKNSLVFMRFLLQKGADPNAQDKQGNTPLIIAVREGNLESVQVLLLYKANPNLSNRSGETPLIVAVQMRNTEMVRTLLDVGANPDKTDNVTGQSARDYAKSDRRAPQIQRLLDAAPKGGATRKAVDPIGPSI